MPRHSSKEYDRAWHHHNRERLNAASKLGRRHYHESTRRWGEFFAHYGTVCVTCGDSDLSHLTFAHLDGGGAQQRGRRAGSLAAIRQVRALGWPETLTLPDGTTTRIGVQCWNCNASSYFRGPDWSTEVLLAFGKATEK